MTSGILARINEIDSIVREHAAEAERERRLTTAVVDALRLFRRSVCSSAERPQ
jgi:hypothetical protein